MPPMPPSPKRNPDKARQHDITERQSNTTQPVQAVTFQGWLGWDSHPRHSHTRQHSYMTLYWYMHACIVHTKNLMSVGQSKSGKWHGQLFRAGLALISAVYACL